MKIAVNGEEFEVEVVKSERHKVTFNLDGRTYCVEHVKDIASKSLTPTGKTKSSSPVAASNRGVGNFGEVCAPIPGVVVAILTTSGQKVKQGDVLLRIEAMKMENNIFSPCAGTIATVSVELGQEVSDGQLLLTITPDA